MTQAVLFDLDGTLADTALDLGGVLNTVLRRHGLPEKSMDEIRPQASHGASGLLKLGADITPDHTVCYRRYCPAQHPLATQAYCRPMPLCKSRPIPAFANPN